MIIVNSRPSTLTLPSPSEAEQRISQALQQRLLASIDADGPMPFDVYMARVLYEPELGYYSGPRVQFGAEGDFVTSPEQGRLFAHALAVHINAISAALDPGWMVLEPGAGSGALAAELLPALDPPPARYLILEPSPHLREAQRQRLQHLDATLRDRVEWVTHPPDHAWQGVVVANEVLDALPVKRFEMTNHGVAELAVRTDGGGLTWCHIAPHAELVKAIEPLGLPSGYCSEWCPAMPDWIGQLSATLSKGVLLLIDYGYPRQEFYHPDRSQGTLVCHYRHRAHFDPLLWPGLNDVSAFVDFTAVAEAAHHVGLQVLEFTTQAGLLLGSGIHERLHQNEDLRQQLSLVAEFKRLMLPGEMGEKFKLLVLGHGLTEAMPGLADWSQRHRL
jgi:SAM-dependent MidA family methyltransferase